MAKFVKATVDRTGEETYINIDHVTRLVQCTEYTVIHFENDKSVCVTTTTEDLLASAKALDNV
jgi:hypothetical protein